MATLVTHGHINFDEGVPPEFVDLVRQTLDQSEFIETEKFEADNPLNNIVLIHEVQE